MIGGGAAAADRRHISSWPTVLRTFAELSTGEILARLVGFVALVALTRRLGPVSFGVITLGLTFVLWLKQIVDAGTETLGLRQLSRHPGRFAEIAGPVLGLRLCISAVVVAAFSVVPFVVDDGDSRWTLWLFALALPAIALNPRFMVLGLQAAKGIAAANVARQLLFAAGVLVLVGGPQRMFVVPLLVAAAELLYAILVIAYVARRFGLPVPKVDLRAWRTALRSGLPLMGNQLSRGVVQSFDLFLIALVLGSYSTGLYGAAYKPLLFVTTLLALLGGSFLASYSAANPAQAAELFHKMTRLSIFVAVPLALAVSIGARPLLSLAFGDEYRGGATALAILAWLIPPAMVGSVYSTVLIARDRQAALMRHNIAGAVLNVGANLVVIPLAGITGAAVVTVVSSALVAVLNQRTCRLLGLAPGLRVRHVVAGLRTDAQPPAV